MHPKPSFEVLGTLVMKEENNDCPNILRQSSAAHFSLDHRQDPFPSGI